MITTKAYITQLPDNDSNIYKVRVPLMEDNTGTEAIFDATLCSYDVYNPLKVGDVVFVTYEDDQYNNAIILGKLYTEVSTESSSYTLVNELKVTDTAILPPNTTLGEYSVEDITALMNAARNIGSGNVDEDQLKQYVKWVNTERVDPTTTEEYDYFANKIRVCTGEEYEAFVDSEGEDYDPDEVNETLYFLTSPPPHETGRE